MSVNKDSQDDGVTDSPQNPMLKRLVGATVLVAGAVLFLPWLFDGAGYESLQGLERPLDPSLPLFASEAPLPLPPVPASLQNDAIAGESVSSGSSPDDTTMEGEPPALAPAAVPPVPAPPTTATPERRTPAEVPPPAPPAAPAAPASAPERPPVASGSGSSRAGWAVQVGVFQQERNARDVSRTLRQLGIEVSLEPVQLNGQEAWRVQTRSYPQREQADRLLQEIRFKANIPEAWIRPYP